ncbi:hypothetical protein ACFLX7_05080 [Chloroflexota bacterium]
MEKTWKPVVAGILNRVSGAVGLVVVLGLIIAITVISWPLALAGSIGGVIPGFVPNLLLIITFLVAAASNSG